MSAGETLVVRVEEESAVGEARRAVRRVAASIGLDDLVAERAALVVTEAARNVVRHGRGGFVALRALEGAAPGIEVLAVDAGPGISDVAAALRDGHSTGGTAGQGLGAMRRLATAFDVWSAPGGDFSGTTSASTSVNAVGDYTWSGAGLVADVMADVVPHVVIMSKKK